MRRICNYLQRLQSRFEARRFAGPVRHVQAETTIGVSNLQMDSSTDSFKECGPGQFCRFGQICDDHGHPASLKWGWPLFASSCKWPEAPFGLSGINIGRRTPSPASQACMATLLRVWVKYHLFLIIALPTVQIGPPADFFFVEELRT